MTLGLVSEEKARETGLGSLFFAGNEPGRAHMQLGEAPGRRGRDVGLHPREEKPACGGPCPAMVGEDRAVALSCDRCRKALSQTEMSAGVTSSGREFHGIPMRVESS